MLNYEGTKNNPKQFLALTSLMVEEFEYLSEEFQKDWWRYYQYHTLRGKKRKNPLIAERADVSLSTPEEKLFFVLVHLKNNPLNEFQAACFGLSEGKTSEWVTLLLKILQQTLKRLKLIPCRDGAMIKPLLEKLNIHKVTLDATERSVQRSGDNQVQEEYYSGKKKDHTIKNNLLVTDQQEVVYLSSTYEGRVHDKAICDEEEVQFPEGITLRQDSGYVGHRPEKVIIVEPCKKPKGKELTEEQKKSNTDISKLRIVVEHAISGIKRCRIVKDIIRIYNHWFRDMIMEVCCGLHNLRVKSSLRAYACARV